jgi:hypothetical protein
VLTSVIDWISTGPKSYCYKTNTGKVVCRIKGFTLNYETSEKINSDSINNILEYKDKKSVHNIIELPEILKLKNF